MTRRWTLVDDLVTTLRRRWDRGLYLDAYARGDDWTTVVLPVRAPTAAEILDDVDVAARWAERFRRDSRTAGGRRRFAVEHRIVQGSGLGVNEVPARIRVETFEQLCSLVGTTGEVRALDAILEQTEAACPALVPWVRTHASIALAHRDIWALLLETVRWIAGHETARLYVRHIDVAGVDTKFVERHHRILGQLLTAVLPPDRIDPDASTFAARFRFRTKPSYVRLRLLSPIDLFPPQISEVRLRADELADVELPVNTVFVVENETSYLTFPEVPDSIVVFGEGFGLGALERVAWLHRRDIVYWGDIDTHGFAILNRLRSEFANVTSILMDEQTLLAHSTQLVSEPSQTREALVHLTVDERSVYRDLIEARFGPAVRLEQERVRFSLLQSALRPWLLMVRPSATDRPEPSSRVSETSNCPAPSPHVGGTVSTMTEDRHWTAEELERLGPDERARIVKQGTVTDLSHVPGEFLDRARAKGRALLEERGVITTDIRDA